MRYSVRHQDNVGEVVHIQFEARECATQNLILMGAGILYVHPLLQFTGGSWHRWCVYDESNTALPKGNYLSNNYSDEPELRGSKNPTEYFDVEF